MAGLPVRSAWVCVGPPLMRQRPYVGSTSNLVAAYRATATILHQVIPARNKTDNTSRVLLTGIPLVAANNAVCKLQAWHNCTK